MEKSFPFNAVLVEGVPDRVYTAEDFASERASYVTDGILSAAALTVSAGTGLTVSAAAGRAVIRGYTYENTADLTLTLEEADETYSRLDRIVLRLDLSARSIYAAVLTGEPAAVPEKPALADTALTKEIPLCAVTVAAGAAALTAENLEDERVRADYLLDHTEIAEVEARYRAAIAEYFGTADAQAIARTASVLSTTAGANTVLCGDGAYRAAQLDGQRKVELARFDTAGTYTFRAENYPSVGNLYEVIVQGAGGSGAHALTGAGGLGGSAGAYVVAPLLRIRDGVNCTVVVGRGGLPMTGASSQQRGGNAGGLSYFRVLGETYMAAGGAGGGITGSAVYPPDTSGRGGTNTGGGASLLSAGGASFTGTTFGNGTAGSLGSGGGSGFGPANVSPRYSGAGGDGCVIVYGIA